MDAGTLHDEERQVSESKLVAGQAEVVPVLWRRFPSCSATDSTNCQADAHTLVGHPTPLASTLDKTYCESRFAAVAYEQYPQQSRTLDPSNSALDCPINSTQEESLLQPCSLCCLAPSLVSVFLSLSLPSLEDESDLSTNRNTAYIIGFSDVPAHSASFKTECPIDVPSRLYEYILFRRIT